MSNRRKARLLSNFRSRITDFEKKCDESQKVPISDSSVDRLGNGEETFHHHLDVDVLYLELAVCWKTD